MMNNLRTSPEKPEGQVSKPIGVEPTSRVLRTTYIVSAVILLITIIQSALNFISLRAWQILGDGSFIVLALAVLLRSRSLYLKGQTQRAKNLIPLIILFAFAPGEIFLDGVAIYNTITGILLFVMAYILFRPQKKLSWVLTPIGFLAIELIFSQINVFPQFDVRTSESWASSLPITAGVVSVVFLVQLIFTIRLRTIQSKMLVGLISLAILPAVVIGFVTGYLGFQETIDQISLNLDAVSTLKQEQIDSWLAKSSSDLNSLLQSPRFVNNASLLPYFAQENYYHTEVLADMETVMTSTGNFKRMYIIGPEGTVILSTDRTLLGRDFSQGNLMDLWFNGAFGEYTKPAYIDPETNQLTVQIALPIISDENTSVLVGDLEISNLLSITSDTSNLGETGETYLLDANSLLLTPLRYAEDELPGQDQISLRSGSNFGDSFTGYSGQYLNYRYQQVLGSQVWLPQLQTVLVVEQLRSEAFEPINFALSIDGVIAAATSLIAIVFAFTFTRSISQPMRELSETAGRVSRRELETMEPMAREDEIGELSRSLSEMTSQMLQTSQNLENTVAERTAVLERRATYLEATAEIGRAITEILNLEDLLSSVTHLISDRFGFYHVGVFIIDPNREYAELKAANSEGGWRMLAREHKLKVGEQGIVGYVTGTGQARIQQQVAGEDSVYYNNPDLPLTKSEMALPIISGGEVLGCLDVQSTQEEAFSEEDVRVLQVLADEVAVAITNTSLFQQLQDSLETERRVFGQITQDAWRKLIEDQQIVSGFKADPSGIQVASDIKLRESEQAFISGQTVIGELDENEQVFPLSVPIKVRGGHVVAVIETSKPGAAGSWSREEIEILEGVGEQLGVALENARLFEETQRSASRERITAELSGKIWASTDIDTILQTAVRELGTALSATEGSISLSLHEEPNGSDDSSDGAGEA